MTECVKKYDRIVYDMFSACFAYLPLAHIVNKKIFIVHGGLMNEKLSLDQVNQLDRFIETIPKNSLVKDLLWSDPSDQPGRQKSRRGAGVLFGGDVLQEFLEENKLWWFIRSHQNCQDGFQNRFDNLFTTVFSASHYCRGENMGAVILLNSNLSWKVMQWDETHHTLAYNPGFVVETGYFDPTGVRVIRSVSPRPQSRESRKSLAAKIKVQVSRLKQIITLITP